MKLIREIIASRFFITLFSDKDNNRLIKLLKHAEVITIFIILIYLNRSQLLLECKELFLVYMVKRAKLRKLCPIQENILVFDSSIIEK